MRLVLLSSFVLFGVVACDGEERITPPETQPSGPAAPLEEPGPDEPALREGQTLPDIHPDEMSRAELESACFRGSQEACDRLGH